MITREPNPAMDAWIAEAKAVPVAEAVARMPGLKRIGKQMEGPCPACGGKTRLWVDRTRDKWGCRHCQTGGRGALSLLMHVPGADFLTVCVELAGPAPRQLRGMSEDQRRAAEAARDAARAAREEEAKVREAENAAQEAKARARAQAIWDATWPADASDAVLGYWRLRGLSAVAIPDDIRAIADLGYWHNIGGAWREIGQWPAMVGAIRDSAGAITGVHVTYLARELEDFAFCDAQPADMPRFAAKGKAVITCPETGERLAAKKMQGLAWGGAIRLTPARRYMLVGEGIETTATALAAFNDKRVGAFVGLSLGGMAALDLPQECEAVTFIGDGDSEPGITRRTLEAAAAKAVARSIRARIAMAPEGRDLNDLVMT